MNQGKETSPVGAPPESRRPARWPKVVAVLIVLLVVAGIIAWHFTIGKLRAMKSTWPYKTALSLIQKDSNVVAALGEPIRDASFIPAGSVPTDKSPGTATLRFRVSGPKGTADVAAVTRFDHGQWSMPKLEVTVPGQKAISVDTAPAGGSRAPTWDPTAAGGAGPQGPKPNAPPGPPAKGGPVGPKPEAPGGLEDIKVDLPDLNPQ